MYYDTLFIALAMLVSGMVMCYTDSECENALILSATTFLIVKIILVYRKPFTTVRP
jgi:hypothetical protein